MSLRELAVSNLRCIEHAELEITPGVTLVWGGNGSGKTSLLEAMFLLGRGRSFRTRNNERLIRRGQNHLRVTGRLLGPTGQDVPVGFEVSRDETVARIAGRPAQSLAELAQAFPVQAVDPSVHRLVEEGGHRRRRWMDWAVFHVEPRFMDEWLRYSRALRQRNAAQSPACRPYRRQCVRCARQGVITQRHEGRLTSVSRPNLVRVFIW